MKIRIGASSILLATILITGSFSYTVVSTLAGYERPVPRVATWSPPDIQQCDLELWERIRGNCP